MYSKAVLKKVPMILSVHWTSIWQNTKYIISKPLLYITQCLRDPASHSEHLNLNVVIYIVHCGPVDVKRERGTLWCVDICFQSLQIPKLNCATKCNMKLIWFMYLLPLANYAFNGNFAASGLFTVVGVEVLERKTDAALTVSVARSWQLMY